MKMKKILLVGLILLAILTVGAVSATDDTDFNETLTVEETQELSGDVSFDDNLNEVEEDTLSDGEITEDNFNLEVSSHEYVDADWEQNVVNVWGDESVRQGSINITIVKDGNSYTDERDFGDGENVIWKLDELKEHILNEIGTYTISLKYLKDDTEIDFGEYDFKLTKYNINTMEGKIYKDYPFEIIKIYDDVYAEVYVNGGDEAFRDDWTLSGLGIESLGDYNITLVTYQDEDVADNFTFTVNVVDEIEWFRAYSSFEVQSDDLTNPVLYLYSPDSQLNVNLNIFVNDKFLSDFTVSSNWMSWNLTDLGIEENENYNVRFENDDGYLCDAWVNVQGIINENCFHPWVSSHEPADADWNPDVAKVDVDSNVEEGEVNITISKDSGVVFTDVKLIGEDILWTLDELREQNVLNQAGTYTFTFKYIKDETEIDLGEYDFTLTKYNYNTMEDELYIDYPFEIIKMYDEVNVEVYVNGELCTVEDENQLSWTLSDLNITSLGDYDITIVAYDDGEVADNFTFTLNVKDSMDWFRVYAPFEVETDDLENPVLYLYAPDDQFGETISMFIGEDFFKDVTVESNWMNWTLEDLGIEQNGEYEIKFENDDGYLCDAWLNVEGFKQLNVELWDFEERTLYADTVGTVIRIYRTDDMSGMLDIIINDTVLYHTIFTSANNEDDFDAYEWDLKSLGITEAGVYNVTLKFVDDEDVLINEYLFEVVDFDNSTFRAKVIGDDEPFYLYLFTPEGETGTVSLTFIGWDDELEEDVIAGNATLELNKSYWNKWRMISDFMNYDADRVEIVIGDEEIDVEYSYPKDTGNYFTVIEDEVEIRSGEDIVLWVYANTTDNTYTINITNGDDSFIANVMDLGDYEWVNGHYKYYITLDDLSSLNFNDKDKVTITYDIGNLKSLAYRWSPATIYVVEKNDDSIKLRDYWSIRVDLIKIELAYNEEDEEQDENYQFDDNQLVRITVPDSLNIHQTAIVHIIYGDNEITKNLSELSNEYNYNNLAVNYYILLSDLDLENLKNKDILNVSVTSADEFIGSRNFIMFADDEEGWSIDYFADSISLILYYGVIGNLEFGMDGDPDKIIELTIPEYLNITEGTVIITDENGTVIFSKSLSEFEENCTDYDGQTYGYWISDNEEEFDYSIFKENVPFAVSFAYGNTTKVYARGIREGDELHRITTPENVADYFKVTLSEGILINGSDNAIIIEPTDNANRQSVNIDLGGGIFVVYVNGVKVENLGRLVGFDNETELELYLLQRGSGDGSTKLFIYLSDLNITDNGEYNIRVTHQPEHDEKVEVTSSNRESELFNQNITLTSNVKVDNVTSEVFTGFGMDPILLYLDTYYGDINETSGKITVINSDGDEIFTKDIKTLSKDENGRYYLKYSDFENKNFGENITVMYSDGNERSGNTTVNVTWQDIDSDVFNPVVNDDVNDYYGDFINLEIPDLLTTGQIIVTLKFKGNHTTNLPMNVTSDFGSQAVYRFNVADIKANYPDGFRLSLSDLGFYEDDGDYDVDVKFTANGEDTLDVTNNTLNVAFSNDIIISINETLRYTYEVLFASVKVFEPTNAYVDLYIDGLLFAHKTVFEDGLITFTSSKSWASGNHTAEIRVIQSEFDRLLNSSTVEFNVWTQTEDVNVSISDNVKENEHVLINITVPKAGNVTVDGIPHEVSAGLNTIDLGTLSYGNHTMWVLYEEELDDGNVSFYNNYVSVFVGDDGHWLSVPDPLVLKDDDTIKMNLGESATGYVLLYLDDKLVANKTLVKGEANITIIDEMFDDDYVPDLLGASGSQNKYGRHTYKIIYSGDATHDSLTQTGEFTIAYLFKDDIASENPLKETYDVTITLPDDANGTVRITVNNKPYTSQVKGGKASFKVDNLTFGAHDVFIEYIGDDYPYGSYNNVLNISYYEVMGEYSTDAKFVSLMLPANATGNLTIVNTNVRNGKYDLFSVPISGDITKIDLSALPVGIYDLLAYYDGSDYDVRSFATSFKVMPTVIITQDTVIGENLTIFVDLNNSTGSLLIILDGLSPVLEKIIDGKINYTMSTEGYSYGNHSVTFYYVGDSFDGNVFNELDTTTGYFVPIKYSVEILPIKVLPKDESDNDEEYLIYMYDEDGNFLSDASGQIEVTVLDRLTGQYRNYVLDVVNGIARLSLSGLKDGDYSISWKYLGDKKYGSFSKSLLLSIKHKVAKITAGDLNMQYTSGKTYTVTVYTKDGKLASGIAVSFLINNKAYGNVITNANGVASIVMNSAPGTYQITSSALGVSVTKKLTVTKILSLKNAKVKRSAKKLVLKATLKKVNGKFLKGKKITFKFNGKKYTAKTNKKGVAKVTIKKKVLKKLKKGKKVTYQATYLKDTVKKTVKVKK